MGGRLGLERISFFFEKKEREHIEHFGPWASLYWAATKRAQKPKPKAHRRFDLEKLELPLRPPPSPFLSLRAGAVEPAPHQPTGASTPAATHRRGKSSSSVFAVALPRFTGLGLAWGRGSVPIRW